VTFVARGAQLEALRRRGIRIRSSLGDFSVKPVVVTDDLSPAAQADAIIVAVKTWQLVEAARSLAPALGPSTVVLPLLNGVEAYGVLAGECGEANVLKGLAMILSHVSAPGEVTHVGGPPGVTFGEPDSRPSSRVSRLCESLVAAGIKATVAPDIDTALWRKFLFVASFGAVGALTRAPAGVIRRVAETRALVERGMHEAAEVALAHGVALEPDAVTRAMTLLDALPEEARTSLQRDLAAGRRSELETWSGAVVRLGKERDVPTPFHEFAYHALLPLELRARGDLAYQ
jgi:2-dehydropantoate 2-reductase